MKREVPDVSVKSHMIACFEVITADTGNVNREEVEKVKILIRQEAEELLRRIPHRGPESMTEHAMLKLAIIHLCPLIEEYVNTGVKRINFEALEIINEDFAPKDDDGDSKDSEQEGNMPAS